MPSLFHEQQLQREGYRVVAGIDEAGRGPLAGPVAAAAVILPREYEHTLLDDSKKLSPAIRERLFEEITADPDITWACCLVEPVEIDRINILQATHRAMRGALEALAIRADAALIDGRPVPEFPIHHQGIIKGDSLCLSVSAASIIAKVQRDRIMCGHALNWPEYGFEKHKGYGTRAHLEALRRHGPCPIHRRSFAPVRECGVGLRLESDR